MLYFAYGSNMDEDQIRQRCPEFTFICTGVLAEHKLTFPRFSKTRRCGAASIGPAPGGRVWGVVYRLTHEDRDTLRSKEGYIPGRAPERQSYLEEPIVVHRSDGTELADVFTYIANPDPDGPYRPSEEYKALIIRGAARWELPNEYQESLSELQVQ